MEPLDINIKGEIGEAYLTQLGVPPQTTRKLASRYGLSQVKDTKDWSDEDLYAMANFTRHIIEHLIQALNQIGFVRTPTPISIALGITQEIVERLAEHGYRTIRQLVFATPAQISRLKIGLNVAQARELRAAAQKMLDEQKSA